MTPAVSLRARLTAIILGPLLLIAGAVGYWAWQNAIDSAADRFDRSLLSTALAISRDTAFTGGDALSEDTRDLLRDTSGGPVFYHVYAPDGVFVTGYATPPVPPSSVDPSAPQSYYDAVYQDRPVRALRFFEPMEIDGLSGAFTFTVWQDTSVRAARVQSLLRTTAVVIATLMAALAVVVWFGVRVGLRPLNDLEDAISRRSAKDLSPIRRAIPAEVTGIVGTLNGLLDELSATMNAKDTFISNAAHQLRNPIAGVLSLAETLQTAPDEPTMRTRGADIVEAARELSHLAQGLLTLERASALAPETLDVVDVAALLRGHIPDYRASMHDRSVAFSAMIPETSVKVRADALLLEQSVRNLITNALFHGGDTLDEVELSLAVSAGACTITVRDNGKGIEPDQVDTALSRFGQVVPSDGSGLGLAIVEAATTAFGGRVELDTSHTGLAVTISLPLTNDRPQ